MGRRCKVSLPIKPFHNRGLKQVLKVLAVIYGLQFMEGRHPLHNHGCVPLV